MILHNNATTNKKQRNLIQNSSDKVSVLSERLSVSELTIRKWKNRDYTHDKSSRPNRIHYALDEGSQELLVLIRKVTWFPVDDVVELLKPFIPNLGHSNCARTFVRYKVNKIPQQEKETRKKFKEYDPGFIHVDVTYLPKLNGTRKYVYVAIDRATRLIYIKLMDRRCIESSEQFLQECIEFYPYKITKVLTDNGHEFSYKHLRPDRQTENEHLFDKVCRENDIEHRTTKIKSPWTNGLVERVNRTLKENTIYKYKYDSYDQLDKALRNFMEYYNLYRKHKCLQRKTPYQVTLDWFSKKPELFWKRPNKIYNLVIPYS